MSRIEVVETEHAVTVMQDSAAVAIVYKGKYGDLAKTQAERLAEILRLGLPIEGDGL